MVELSPQHERTVALEQSAQAAPDGFLDWLIEGRREIFTALEQGEFPKTFASHLPAVSTLGSGRFPIHSANKGVGLTPHDSAIPGLLEQTNEVLEWAERNPWKESQARRIEVARLLYDDTAVIDRRRFGLIEIFRGQTYRNIEARPQATLLFTGVAPFWRSYQVNCSVEIVGPEDLRFQYVLAMRRLFERDRFHIQQPDYPIGYLFWINEVVEKTPRFGKAGRHLVGSKSRHS